MLDFLQSTPVQTALALSAAAALLCAIVGLFTLIRGQVFAGHALADVSSAGGAGSLLFGISPLLGFMLFGLAGASTLEIIQSKRREVRDESAGLLLGAGMGVTALLLHFCLTHHGASGAAQTVMFGNMFAVPLSTVFSTWILTIFCLIILGFIARPLLLISLDQDLASISGLPVRILAMAFMLLLAFSVTLSAMTVGAVLATALLVGPPSVALHLGRNIYQTILISLACGLISCWGGILLAYMSYSWLPGRTWPVSFFIVTLLLLFYLISRAKK